MTELEKLEKELLEEIQEEPEIYADTEEFCTINPETRIITVPTSKRILGTESDQETNRLYFKCPKIVGDNVDLSLFSLRINYQNAGNKKDQYLVEDVKVEGDNITFSWLFKRNVTAYKGNVKFILCAVKTTEDGIIKNEWNTTLNTECESLEGMEVDKVAVEEETKDIVEQLIAMMNHSAENAVRAVEEAKAEVDKEVGDFALKAQQALADVNNAGQAQTESVQTAGNDAVESIKAAQGTAARAVETAKTEAIEAVQTEGTTQAGNVSAEGEKQVQAVRGAAQEIMADREQIQENKTGIAKLKEDLSRVEKDTYVKKEIEKEKKEWVGIDLTSGYSDGCFDKDKKRINWTNMNYSHHVYDVKEGEKYKINARVPDANIPLIVFTDIENNTIDFIPNPITTVRITSEVIIPAGSTRMYINHNGDTDNANSYYLWELSKYVVTPAVIEKKPIKDYVVSNLFGKKIVCNGDSIVKGQGYYGNTKGDKSYVNIIAEKYNMNCINYAVSGGTLSSGSNVNVHHICDDVMNMDVDADYIIVGGGYNDWLYNTPLGEITNNYTDEVNANGRVLGGAELLCRNLLSRFKGKKVGFVFSHKIKESPYTQNKSWDNKPYTMTECHDEIVSVLRKYSIPYLDLYNDSALNTALSDYLLYTANSDGTHPTKEGYEIFYCDKFENFLLSL